MTSVFKNELIDSLNESVIGKHMFNHNQARKQSRAKSARKLIGSYLSERILIYAPMLKCYLSHGMEITKAYCFVEAISHKALATLIESVSNARQEGDVDKSKAMIADMIKVVGTSAFNQAGMDISKHKEVKYESIYKAIKNKRVTYHGLEELNDGCKKKRRLNNTNPIHLSIAIY
ncbi:chromodomain protein, putative [Plasmopara halstedii]|uniref:Chromodomain protein, putative n=1 Tax=Plasmopara halstedii TaxID=4781 RepID=A0A0N7L701_PLAHL|nr:chromodomain protein, putative [Plasmopara halstedii]CEG45699.1 chromodomain protein, putative [Plasmopara halstedii]|eukprot:XP_024582068.1 chromodomain protein, putative [Plasmopara halstedii]